MFFRLARSKLFSVSPYPGLIFTICWFAYLYVCLHFIESNSAYVVYVGKGPAGGIAFAPVAGAAERPLKRHGPFSFSEIFPNGGYKLRRGWKTCAMNIRPDVFDTACKGSFQIPCMGTHWKAHCRVPCCAKMGKAKKRKGGHPEGWRSW